MIEPENDLALCISPEFGIYDLVLEDDGTDLKAGIDLETAIVISLFSDRRTTAEDRIPNAKGWAGDDVRKPGEALVGSTMW